MNNHHKTGNSKKKKIWIDFDNTPHVVFFRPIIEQLQKQGYQVALTARDCSQTCGLADRFNISYRRIGRHYGKNKLLKVAGLVIRALQMMPTLLKEKPDLAISHGSRSQLISASLLKIPSVFIFDYEYAKAIPLIYPTWVMVPDLIPDNAVTFNKRKLLRYPGIKEDVYAPRFHPDPDIKKELNLDDKNLIITIRPPAMDAHYYNPDSKRLFESVINYLGQVQDVRMILLPRNEKQITFIKNMWPEMSSNGKMIIPDHVVDGLNLIWHSDLVISGGGTMNREAAALGVPVYSIFRGKIGAVDKFLADTGRLTLLESAEDLHNKIILKRRNQEDKPEFNNSVALQRIVEHIVGVLDS